ncbi:MAG: hypothetical protein ACT443_14480 [Gemmatimonadota bacterium]
MLKFIVGFILLLGAAFGVPSVRARITPPLMPVLEKLGPVGAKLSDPAKKWSARNEANMLIRKLAEDYAEKKELPSALRFQVWIKMNTKLGNQGLDPWGRAYWMVHTNHQLTVGSNGPDRERNTSDDVRVTVPFH